MRMKKEKDKQKNRIQEMLDNSVTKLPIVHMNSPKDKKYKLLLKNRIKSNKLLNKNTIKCYQPRFYKTKEKYHRVLLNSSNY